MKKLIIILALLTFVFGDSLAKKPEMECVTMDYLDKQLKENPNLSNIMQQFEGQIQQWIKNRRKSDQTLATGTLTIPVVVHVVYNTDEQNIPDDDVITQIGFCNRDFSGQNINPMEAFSPTLKANTNIQFVLAKKAPDGSATSGIERRYSDVVEFTNTVKYYSTGGMDGWDPYTYLNIWVCNTQGRMCWAQFPYLINETYGIVVDYDVFGPNGAQGIWDRGSITSHEIGHCFNLRHVWADDQGSCDGTDYVDDTPNQADYTIGNPEGVLTDACTQNAPGIMYMNFMDYTNDYCLANFTPGQSDRMWACFASDGPLEILGNSTAGDVPTGCEVATSLKPLALKKASAILMWADMVNSEGYNLRYRKIGDSWTTIQTKDNIKYLDGLSRTTDYEFQVQNICSSGPTDYSYILGFSTLKRDPSSLSAPSLSSPANYATGISTNPTLSWESVVSATGYIVQYSTTSDFTSSIELYSQSTSLEITGLAANTRYYWRVLAFMPQTSSNWSSAYNFTTESGVFSAPTLIAPSNNSTGVSRTPTLSWSSVSGAEYYEVDVVDEKSFLRQYAPIGTSIELNGLDFDMQYTWKVRAVKDGGNSFTDWSAEWVFTTESDNLQAPTLLLPPDNSVQISTNPTLEWSNVNFADYYTLEYSTSSNFSQSITVSPIYGTSANISGLSKKTTYYWRVMAHNPWMWSNWSNVFQFKTSPKGKIANDDFPIRDIINNEVSHISVYPNPFSGKTNFEIQTFSEEYIDLSIYDLFGKKIHTVAAGNFKPGIYNYDFTGDILPAGIYYCRMTNGNTTRTVIINLIK